MSKRTEIYWECTYCPKIGKRFRISDMEYTRIKVDPGCPNCRHPWAMFKRIEVVHGPDAQKRGE